MKRLPAALTARALVAATLLGFPLPVALAQKTQPAPKAAGAQPSAQTTTAALDRLASSGKSPQELAQYVFETQGCKSCHTVGQNGKLGFTEKGKQAGQGFEGCISTLREMSVIAKVPEDRRSGTQRRRTERFTEFGCATCHKVTPEEMGLTEVGARLAHLHLGCVDVEKLLAVTPVSQR